MSRRTGAGTRYSAKGKGSCCTGCVQQLLKSRVLGGGEGKEGGGRGIGCGRHNKHSSASA